MSNEKLESKDFQSEATLMNGRVIDLLTQKEVGAEESLGSKLLRESQLLQQGIKQGIGNRVQEMIANPGTTAIQVSVALAAGATSGALNAAGGRYGTAARVLEGMATAYATYHTALRVIDTADAMSDVWNDPWNFNRSKDRVASSLGGLIVDLPMFLGSAALAEHAAGKFAANRLLTKGIEPYVGLPRYSGTTDLRPGLVSLNAGSIGFAVSRPRDEIVRSDGSILMRPLTSR